MVDETLLRKFNPNAEALMLAISPLITDAMLLEIASCDYAMGVEEHLERLLEIRDRNVVFVPIQWEPKEVLTLTHYGQPEKYYKLDAVRLHTEHLERAFACAAILRASVEPGNWGKFFSDNSACAALLDSLAKLDPGLEQAALQFFAWRVQDTLAADAEDKPFHLLSLLILLLRTSPKLPHDELKMVIGWIYAAVRVQAEETPTVVTLADKPHWLRWLTSFEAHHALWQTLGTEIAQRAEHYANAEGRQNLKALARHLERLR